MSAAGEETVTAANEVVDSVRACCSTLYSSPLADLLVGESWHPGGTTSTRRLLRAGGLAPGARLLDVGCGLGASARLAASEFGLRVHAVDVDATVLARARSRSGDDTITWTQADVGGKLPVASGTVDGVLAECVLSTVPRAAALAEIRRVLTPGGLLLISDVEVRGTPIDGLDSHPVLGALLCIHGAWLRGEPSSRLEAEGFDVRASWDLSPAIASLVDRVEARVSLASAAARRLGLDLAELARSIQPGGTERMDRDSMVRVADSVRAAVARGDLRYFACVARSPVATIPA